MFFDDMLFLRVVRECAELAAVDWVDGGVVYVYCKGADLQYLPGERR